MRPTLDRCDADGVSAYLEASSERSAALYERLGFVHLGMLELPDEGPRFGRCNGSPTASHPLRGSGAKSMAWPSVLE
jgi:hypothetical protein